MKKANYKEWLKWREEYFEGNSRMLNRAELTEEEQMEAWGRYLKETDSGHRPS